MVKKAESVLDLPVSFGGVSFGDKTARVGVTVEREHLKITVADKNLCDKRLTGTIESKASDSDGQGRLEGFDDKLQLTGIFDVKGFSVHTNDISFGLTFALKDLDRSTLSEFPKRAGRLIIAGVDAIPDESPDEDDDDYDAKEKPVRAADASDEAWRATPIRDALKGLGKKIYEGIDKLLGPGATVGQLFDWKNKNDYHQWQDIEGLGKAGATKIDDAIEVFWTKVAKDQQAAAKAAAEKPADDTPDEGDEDAE